MCENYFASQADRVLLEVVPDMPVLYGDNLIHISEVDAVYECDRPYPVLPAGDISEVDMEIGRRVSRLVMTARRFSSA